MIQGRPEMIDHFACEDRQFKRRISEDAQLLCAIRISDDFERIVASIFGDAILKGLMIFHDPDDFRLGRFECIRHEKEKNTKDAQARPRDWPATLSNGPTSSPPDATTKAKSGKSSTAVTMCSRTSALQPQRLRA